MGDDLQQRRLNAIVGEAIKGLVESGADSEFIGAFAVSHREKIASLMGLTSALPPSAPDLLELVAKGAQLALEQAGLIKKPREGTAKRVSVVVGGKRTTVSVSQQLMRQLTESRGNESSAVRLIQDVAAHVPLDAENRSAWIEDRLRSVLLFGGDSGTPGAATH